MYLPKTESKNRIIKFIHDAKTVILTVLVLLLVGNPVFALTQQEAIDQINQLNQQNKAAQNQVSTLRGQANTLSNQLAIYDAQINQLQVQINSAQAEINLINGQIETTNTQIKQAEDDLVKQKEIMDEYLRTMYIEGQTSTLELIVSSNSFSEFVSKNEYLNTMQQNVQDTANKIVALRTELDQKKQDLQVKQAKAQQLKGSIVAQQIEANNQRSQANYLLDVTNGNEANYQKAISNNNASIGVLQCIAYGGCNGDSGGNLVAINTYPYYNQKDFSYSYAPGYTIANTGCLITSLAMAHNVDPVTEAKSHSYSDGGMNIGGTWGDWSSLTGLINSKLAAGKQVIVGLNMAGGYTHFVLIKGRSDDKYYINDPYFGVGQTYNTSRVYEVVLP